MKNNVNEKSNFKRKYNSFLSWMHYIKSDYYASGKTVLISNNNGC